MDQRSAEPLLESKVCCFDSFLVLYGSFQGSLYVNNNVAFRLSGAALKSLNLKTIVASLAHVRRRKKPNNDHTPKCEQALGTTSGPPLCSTTMTKPTPFGDDCERPSCDGVKSMFEKAMAASGLPSKPKVATKGDHDDDSPASTVECPPNSAELGRGSWTLLHSMVCLGM